MAGLLGRAKALLGRHEPKAPGASPFLHRCVCGEKSEGLRRREPHCFACAECGATVFVFPVDPLPPLLGKPKKPRPSVAPPPVADDDSADFDVVEEESGPTAAPPPRRTRPAIMERAWLEPELPPPTPTPVPKKTAAAAGLAVALALLGGFAWHRQAVAARARDLPENARKGLQAVHRGQFGEGRAALDRAVAALDDGTPYPEAAAVRQARDEAAAVADLLPEPFDEALAATVATPTEFYRLAGRSVLVDTVLAPAADGRLTAEWTEVAGGKTVLVDVSGVAALAALPVDRSARRLFAVRFVALERQGEGFRLRAGSAGGAVLTEPLLLDLLGLANDPRAAAVLAEQRQILGLAPPAAEAKP